MAALAFRCGDKDITSGDLAMSVNTSPSFCAPVLISRLAKAGLVRTTTGKTGACMLARDPKEISLLDIYQAIGAPKAFSIRQLSRTKKPASMSCHIKDALEKALAKTQTAMEAGLAGIHISNKSFPPT